MSVGLGYNSQLAKIPQVTVVVFWYDKRVISSSELSYVMFILPELLAMHFYNTDHYLIET